MDEKLSPSLTRDEPVVFAMLEAAVDWRDWTVLVEGWLEWLLVVGVVAVVLEKLVYVAACCIAARIDNGFRERDDLDR
jgi:hypothetical protein